MLISNKFNSMMHNGFKLPAVNKKSEFICCATTNYQKLNM